jgi:predicted RecA/RadA family phage recombinase
VATNEVYEKGDQLNLPVPSGVVSGAPTFIGGMTGVAQTDRDTSGNASVDFAGVYSLSVKGANDAGNVAVAVGDPLFYVDADTPKLSKKSSGLFFGYALQTVGSGSTATIQVRKVDPSMPGALGQVAGSSGIFISAEQTGTGSAQNIAHGLGVVPSRVFVAPTDLTPSTVGSYVVTEGTHTITNVVVTVTTSKKFKVLALA